jgi:hypothetical protein
MRKFFEFAPRGAFQARIPGDFSAFLAKPGICLRRNIAFSFGFIWFRRSPAQPHNSHKEKILIAFTHWYENRA